MIWMDKCQLENQQEDSYLVKSNDKHICMRATKNWDIHWNSYCVGLVQTHSKVSFTTQENQNNHTLVEYYDELCILTEYHSPICIRPTLE